MIQSISNQVLAIMNRAVWMLLVFLPIDGVIGSEMNKFQRFVIPPASWQSLKTYLHVRTLSLCAARATKMDAKFFVMDYATNFCEVGSVDITSFSGDATMAVMGKEEIFPGNNGDTASAHSHLKH